MVENEFYGALFIKEDGSIMSMSLTKLYDFIESAKNKRECYKILEEWGI